MAKAIVDIIVRTPVGIVAAVSRGRELLAVEIGLASQRDAVRRILRRFPDAVAGRSEAGRQLREYFAGHRREFSLKPSIGGLGAFYQRALAACARIPFGKVATYGELAAAAGSFGAARAVGTALSLNPCPIVIPCHRVVGADGIGGFSAPGGLDTKRALLEFEGVATGQLDFAGR
jgi:methylated-DNA-[protein]-cysteine S-methyltransferase